MVSIQSLGGGLTRKLVILKLVSLVFESYIRVSSLKALVSKYLLVVYFLGSDNNEVEVRSEIKSFWDYYRIIRRARWTDQL